MFKNKNITIWKAEIKTQRFVFFQGTRRIEGKAQVANEIEKIKPEMDQAVEKVLKMIDHGSTPEDAAKAAKEAIDNIIAPYKAHKEKVDPIFFEWIKTPLKEAKDKIDMNMQQFIEFFEFKRLEIEVKVVKESYGTILRQMKSSPKAGSLAKLDGMKENLGKLYEKVKKYRLFSEHERRRSDLYEYLDLLTNDVNDAEETIKSYYVQKIASNDAVNDKIEQMIAGNRVPDLRDVQLFKDHYQFLLETKDEIQKSGSGNDSSKDILGEIENRLSRMYGIAGRAGIPLEGPIKNMDSLAPAQEITATGEKAMTGKESQIENMRLKVKEYLKFLKETNKKQDNQKQLNALLETCSFVFANKLFEDAAIRKLLDSAGFENIKRKPPVPYTINFRESGKLPARKIKMRYGETIVSWEEEGGRLKSASKSYNTGGQEKS
jgi:predicted RNase H-like HicB family nuclease